MAITLAAVLGIALLQAPSDTMQFRRVEVAPAESVAVGTLGRGPTVVIVPGMLGSAYGFRAVIGPLAAKGFRVVLVDPLGTGSSPSPEKADYSLAAQSVRIGAAARAANVDRAVFLCHSTSAAMCYRLAYGSPDLVAAVVSINGGPAERQATSGMRRALKVAGVIRFIAGDGWARGKVEDGLKKSSADPSWVTDEVMAGYTGYYRDGMGGALSALKRIANSEEPDSLAPLLPNIISPVVLLLGAGTKDGLPPHEEMVRLGTIPRFTVDTIPDAGQYIQEEQPNAVIDAVISVASDVLGRLSPNLAELTVTPLRAPGVIRH
jgi:2-hydroxymuconate-semialdehyde hydrolase